MKTNRPTYEIVEKLAILSRDKNDWVKELNLISWNGGKPKYDIRGWSPDHQRITKGITLTEEEMRNIVRALEERI